MEELARANANGHRHGNGTGADEKKFSLHQNPQHYEHPEHWGRAREPNIYKRVNLASPLLLH